jgi:glutathione peroxidase
MRTLIIILLTVITFNINAMENFYDLKAVKNGGDTLYFSELKGKKLMIVNTASYCGYTDQYEDLQALYEEYGGEHFEIIAFPANNFMNQEPGSDDDIKKFCEENYGVTFTIMSKISVKGTDMHPVYQWLTQKSKNVKLDSEVKWNFQKYLITENGELFNMLTTQTNPINPLVRNWLEEPVSVNESVNNSFVTVSPNPANDFIDINVGSSKLLDNKYSSKILIYNILGECLISQQIVENERINIEPLPSGLYFLKIGSISIPFLKE